MKSPTRKRIQKKSDTGEKLQPFIEDMMKSNETEATVLKDNIMPKCRDFHCHLSAGFLCNEIVTKLKDPSTNEPIDPMEKRFFEERKDERQKITLILSSKK